MTKFILAVFPYKFLKYFSYTLSQGIFTKNLLQMWGFEYFHGGKWKKQLFSNFDYIYWKNDIWV